jgi:hypothetical protein
MRPTGGGGRQKIWRVHAYGWGGLQPLEIPQNGQRFVWKSLDKNSLDLEKLAEMLGRPPSFRRLCSAAATKASLHRCGLQNAHHRRVRGRRAQVANPVRPVTAIAQGFPGARGLAEIANLDQEFAVENRKACAARASTPRMRGARWEALKRVKSP